MNHTSEMVGLLTASLAKSTWLKHGSALKSFKKFEVFSEKKFQWPLSKDCVRGFISWAVLNKKLRPSTVQSYVSSLSYMHMHALLVDRLSRARSTTTNDERLLRSFPEPILPVCLVEWMKNPSEDWDLAMDLLNHVKNTTRNKIIK